jgi:hypothetical protein
MHQLNLLVKLLLQFSDFSGKHALLGISTRFQFRQQGLITSIQIVRLDFLGT